MIKFFIIHMTDSQYRGNNPKGRIDDFPAAMREKFREVFQMAKNILERNKFEHEVIIVHSGDLSDMPDMSDSVAGDFAEVLMESPVPIYVVPGNHDEFVHNLETVYRTKLGLLDRVKVLKVLGREPVRFWVGSKAKQIHLTGQGYHPDIDTTGEDYMAPEPQNNNDWIVHAVHGSLTPEPIYGPHTLIKNCKTNAHVVLTGHLHNGYGIAGKESINNKVIYNCISAQGPREVGSIFSNPGALARVDATPEDMVRPVQVTVLEFTEDTATATLVPLKCAKPGSEVLSREHIVKQTEREENMKKFLSLLNQEGEMKFLTAQEIIRNIADMKQVPKHLVDDVMRRIGKAREYLGREQRKVAG
ncbi:metallophosphoesterase family protein [Phosphitispora fastidiosa]|uniref:metallophosphoesterase family protein n=1 Tax=Phosphitispora fastidiosa TaxID=2837202 RepID=UPI001E63652A|nr:metallophosphoesterase [Phosphitispora fastidiosa]MBU7006344.1 DNA repair exonuclease SbcCD nuclease subunit [Phosphitispora fastidiosa]